MNAITGQAPDTQAEAQKDAAPEGAAQVTTEIATEIVSAADTLRKALATITAALALRGYALHELSDGTFLVSRWNLCKPLEGLHAARQFAKQVGCI